MDHNAEPTDYSKLVPDDYVPDKRDIYERIGDEVTEIIRDRNDGVDDVGWYMDKIWVLSRWLELIENIPSSHRVSEKYDELKLKLNMTTNLISDDVIIFLRHIVEDNSLYDAERILRDVRVKLSREDMGRLPIGTLYREVDVTLDDVARQIDIEGRPDAPPPAPFFATQDVFAALIDSLYAEFGRGTFGPQVQEADYASFATAMTSAFVKAQRSKTVKGGKEPVPFKLATITKRRGDRGHKVSIRVEKTGRPGK